MRLFIAEKPAMAKDIAFALGNATRHNGYFEVGDDIVTFAVGHMLTQALPEAYGHQYAKEAPWTFDVLPIIPQDWKMSVYPKMREQLETVGKLLKHADSVVHAGDAAREGQLIVDEILRHFRFKGPAMRLWLQSMTPAAIRKALSSMKPNTAYANLSAAATARAEADWLSGINLTRAFTIAWKLGGNAGTLHIGRVKTPTLSFVVDRELTIRNFQPKDFFVLRCRVVHPNGGFVATWQPAADAPFLDEEGRIVDRNAAEMAATWFSGMPSEIRQFEIKQKSSPPPLPFSLGDLQKAANRLLGLSPKETLDVAQELYEKHKLTSYPRTDYNHLPEEEHKLGKQLVEAAMSNFGTDWPFKCKPDFSLKSAAWNSKKIGDHHGIRPTETRGYKLASLSAKELAVYRLIVRNFLAQFLPDYRYEATSVEVDCDGERLTAAGNRPIDPGWRVLFGMDDEEKEEDSPPLPPMQAGDLAAVDTVDIETKTTTPPPRYTGATLIDAMERAHLHVADQALKGTLKGSGIGTPATRGPIIEELIEQGYLNLVKKHYHPTDRAIQLYETIPAVLKKPDSTALIEDMLKRIEAGEITAATFMDKHIGEVRRLVDLAKTTRVPSYGGGSAKAAPKNGPPCPTCGKPMLKRNSARGPFLGCSGYPACKTTQDLPEKSTRKTAPSPRGARVAAGK